MNVSERIVADLIGDGDEIESAEWSAVRLGTESGPIYIAATENAAQKLRGPMRNGGIRVVFTRGELEAALPELEQLPADARQQWLRAMIAIKRGLPHARVDFLKVTERAAKQLARRCDPATSKRAAREVAGRLNPLRQRVLEIVRKNPGRTARELSDIVGDRDMRTIGRRLSEVEKDGLLVRGSERKDPSTGKLCATWYAADAAGQLSMRGVSDDR